MQTKHDNDAVRSLVAFLLIMAIFAVIGGGIKVLGALRPGSWFSWNVAGTGVGTPPPPPLSKDGNVKVEGPSDFKAQMANAMSVLKTQAPDSYAKYVLPTLRVIQYSGNNDAPVDNLGVVNMGWWSDGSFAGAGGVAYNRTDPAPFYWPDASYSGIEKNSILPASVYNDPTWVASLIAGYTVESTEYIHSVADSAPACAQASVLREIGGPLVQYAVDASACTVISGGGQ